MRICEVIGTVTLSHVVPGLDGARWLVMAPYRFDELRDGTTAGGELLLAYDELGAGTGSRVGVSEGREAAMPFHPDPKPLDAYCACILDRIALHVGDVVAE